MNYVGRTGTTIARNLDAGILSGLVAGDIAAIWCSGFVPDDDCRRTVERVLAGDFATHEDQTSVRTLGVPLGLLLSGAVTETDYKLGLELVSAGLGVRSSRRAGLRRPTADCDRALRSQFHRSIMAGSGFRAFRCSYLPARGATAAAYRSKYGGAYSASLRGRAPFGEYLSAWLRARFRRARALGPVDAVGVV